MMQPTSDHQSDTMMRDTTLILGAAFIIITLIYVVFQKFESITPPVTVEIARVVSYVESFQTPSQPFRYKGTLQTAQVNQQWSLYHRYLKGGINQHGLILPANSRVFEEENRNLIIISHVEPELIIDYKGVLIAYIKSDNVNNLHTFNFKEYPGEDSTKFEVEYSLRADSLILGSRNLTVKPLGNLETQRKRTEQTVSALIRRSFEDIINE